MNKGEELHLMQAAFMHCDGFQCGFCTPARILWAFAAVLSASTQVSEPP
jgi:xanthine dehydrogenase YagT iron-sulfur-binding subunit